MRIRTTPRVLPAIVLVLTMAISSPAVALRIPQPEAPVQRAGMEEALAQNQPKPPDPKFLVHLSNLARTLTGDYRLVLVPWEPLPSVENDWPQWRFLPGKSFLQYVPEDFNRFRADQVLGLVFESVAVATTFRPEVVEPEYRSNGAFWALTTVMVIPWARARLLKGFPGIAADFARLDNALYHDSKLSDLQASHRQPSSFLQFLRGALYEGRVRQGRFQRTLLAAQQALYESSELRREALALSPRQFYLLLRDKLWPVAQELLEEDLKQEMFLVFQRDPAFRKEMELPRRQKLLASHGRLLLNELTSFQRERFDGILAQRIAVMPEQELEVFRQRLQHRIAAGLERMRSQLVTGILPPLPVDPPARPDNILEFQHQLRRSAEVTLQLTDRLLEKLNRMSSAGLEEGNWRQLSGLAQQMHWEAREMADKVKRASVRTGAFSSRMQAMGAADLPQTRGVFELAGQLHRGNVEIQQRADGLMADTAEFSARVREAAKRRALSEKEIKILLEQARQLRSKAEGLRGEVDQVLTRAEEAELTALELVSEGMALAAGQGQDNPWMRAAERIAQWANPEILQKKAFIEAFSQIVLRILHRLRHLQNRLQSDEIPPEQIRAMLEREMGSLDERMSRLFRRFGIPEELQQKWREQAQALKASDLENALQEALARKSPGGGRGGTSRSPHELLGTDFLKVTPPADPREQPAAPARSASVSEEEPETGAPRPQFPVSQAEWAQREAAARAFQKEAGVRRSGIVEAQIPVFQQYQTARRSFISTAAAHLFQWSTMRRRGGLRTDLLDGELDEEALALARTGTQRLYMEEVPRRKAAGKWLSIVIDVSGSMLQPATEKKKERKIDYVNDLLVTLGGAAAGDKEMKTQIVIFSSWSPNVSAVVKRYNEPWTEAKATQVIDQVLNSNHSGTMDVTAVEEEIRRIRESADPRAQKMLWVLTDGDGEGAERMMEVMKQNPDIRIFGWGFGPKMREGVAQTFGPYGIYIPRMAELVKKGMFVLKREMARPVRTWETGKTGAGLEEAFPLLYPGDGRPGAGELILRREGEETWFEVDGIRIPPPSEPKVTLSEWTVSKLEEMWDVYRLHPKGRNNNLLLYGQAGVGKSLYARYLWEIYRGWLRGKAALMEGPLKGLKQQVQEYAARTQTRVVTFHENLRKADLTERLHLGENAADEAGWTPSDIVEGGRAGDQVILSEVNRAGDEILAELDEPLGSRQKTLYEGVVPFHPGTRFVAAINPPEGQVAYSMGYKGKQLSGQFLNHFTKVMLDYPPRKLQDGSDNPEYALFFKHEVQVLKEVRRRKLADGQWAVPDGVIDGLVRLAGLIREDALQGQAPFVVSTRALVRMVEKMDRFPHLVDQIPDLFFNSYWVDDTVHGEGTRAHLLALIERIFKPSDWPVDRPWPAPRKPAGLPQVSGGTLSYPHWPADVRIPLGPGTGAHIQRPVFFETEENLSRLEDLLMDVALQRNILNMGDTDTGQSYFMELLSKVLRRNLIVLTMSQGFRVRDMLVMRWYSGGKTLWKDSLPLAHLRPDKVLQEGPPIIVWDRGEKGDPGVLAAFNDFLQERRVLLPSGKEFILPQGAIIAMNRTPPRPPYEFYEQSGEFFDRFSHHSYGYLSAEAEAEILHAYHPNLAFGSLLKVVEAAGVLRKLYHASELFEPPGIGVTFTAAAWMAQRPETPVQMADLMIKAYGDLKPAEPAAIRTALEDEQLNVLVHPTLDPELAGLIDRVPQLRLEPEVKADPALWKQLIAMTPYNVERVIQTGEPFQAGWGVQLNPLRDGTVLAAALKPGLGRPFEVYAHLAEALHQKAVREGAVRFRIVEQGIFFQTAGNSNWTRMEGHFGSPGNWSGLRDFLSSRGFRRAAAGPGLTVELPAGDDAAWTQLGWLLDPVTLRRNLPVMGKFLGVSNPLRLEVTQDLALDQLNAFSVGADAVDPADPNRIMPPGFLVRAGLEEKAGASLIRKVPVIAGFLNHGDDPQSVKALELFGQRLNAFLKAHKEVKELIFVQEVGGPFLTQALSQMGMEPGDLVAVAQANPDGFEQMVRPTFEMVMKAVQEKVDGWWSQIYAGEIPSRLDNTVWHQKLFELIHHLSEKGYQVHPVVEHPSASSWWNFLLWQDGVEFIFPRLPPVPSAEDRQKLLDLLALRINSSQDRDDALVGKRLIPLLEDLFLEEEPADPSHIQPLRPEEVAVVMPRGRGHAVRMEPLLKAQFDQVESVRMEELVPEAAPTLDLRYEEALAQGGYRPGEAPPDVEKLFDDQTAEWLAALRTADEAETPQAGMEEVALSPEVSADHVVVVVPAMAEALGYLVRLGQGGAPLRVAVIVRDDAQESRVRAVLEEAGQALSLFGISNLSRTGQTLEQSIVDFQVQAWSRANPMEVFVLDSLKQIRALGPFLKIPSISFRSWREWVEMGLSEAA